MLLILSHVGIGTYACQPLRDLYMFGLNLSASKVLQAFHILKSYKDFISMKPCRHGIQWIRNSGHIIRFMTAVAIIFTNAFYITAIIILQSSLFCGLEARDEGFASVTWPSDTVALGCASERPRHWNNVQISGIKTCPNEYLVKNPVCQLLSCETEAGGLSGTLLHHTSSHLSS